MATNFEDLNHMDLLMARKQPGADQAALAPAEHQAFAREYAAENPMLALGLVPAIPAYQAAKGVGLIGSRTGSSQPGAQMAAGYKGLGQGWSIAFRRMLEGLIPSAAAAESTVADPATIGASPIDRRGPKMGVPLAYEHPASIVAAPVAAPIATPRSFESEYERELRVIRGRRNSLGAQSILSK